MSEASEAVYDKSRLRRARIAVAAVFCVHGAVTGSFATRVPWIQEHASVSAGMLGLALAFPAIGASVAMPLASRISHRFGARNALRGLLALWTLSLILPSLAPNCSRSARRSSCTARRPACRTSRMTRSASRPRPA